MVTSSSAPMTPVDAVLSQLRTRGYAVVAPSALAPLCGCAVQDLHALEASWDTLAPDLYLKDGGGYRRRRHACFTADATVDAAAAAGASLFQAPHRAHWQSTDYNALHGGMHRWFEPITPDVTAQPAWSALLLGLGRLFARLKPVDGWFVEAHQFRIDTTDGIGRPTPEGAHRDGVDFVAVFLVARAGIKGGETRVFDAAGPDGQRFTLVEPWSLLLLDDARVIHESTPIQPLPGAHDAHRDTLVLTYRAGGFQGDDA